MTDVIKALGDLLAVIDDPADRESAVAMERELRRIADARATLTAALASLKGGVAVPWHEDEKTGTLYQVIGTLAEMAGVFQDPAVVRALDLAAYGKTEDGIDVLPFHPTAPSPPADDAGVARIDLATLKWWRELVDLNPDNLAPRLDARIAALSAKEPQT